MNAAPGGLGREAMVERLHAALAALEQGDDRAWRDHVDELVQWRAQPLVQGLVRLGRELEQALGGDGGGASLAEACERLEHVVRMGEASSHHALDLIQECGALLATLPDAPADTLAALRSRLSEMTAAQGWQDLSGQVIRRVVALVRAVDAGTAPAGEAATANRGHGPSQPGLDAAATTQDEANSLLSALGL